MRSGAGENGGCPVTYGMVPFIGSVQKKDVHRDRMKMGGCQGQGRRQEEAGGFLLGGCNVWEVTRIGGVSTV